MNEECCARCVYYRRLKHNFKREIGFEDSYACDVWLHLDSDKDSLIQEVSPMDRCEMFKERP